MGLTESCSRMMLHTEQEREDAIRTFLFGDPQLVERLGLNLLMSVMWNATLDGRDHCEALKELVLKGLSPAELKATLSNLNKYRENAVHICYRALHHYREFESSEQQVEQREDSIQRLVDLLQKKKYIGTDLYVLP